MVHRNKNGINRYKSRPKFTRDNPYFPMQMMNSIRNFRAMMRHFTILLLLSNALFASVTKKIIQNDAHKLVIRVDINASTEADLHPTSFVVGFPAAELPEAHFQFLNKSVFPFTPQQDTISDFEWINQQRLKNLETGTIRVSPLASSKEYYQTIIITLEFSKAYKQFRNSTKMETAFLKNRIVNWETAKSWMIKKKRILGKVEIFPDGQWIQFFLTEDGMASIPYTSLSVVLANISSVDPRSFSIYMAQEFGRSRTQSTNQVMAENLVEIGILVTGEEDGSFDPEDHIIFYGRGSSGFDQIGDDLDWHQNIYFTSNSCWLFIPTDSSLRGKRVTSSTQPETVSITLDYGMTAVHHELDLVNLNGAGTIWLSSPIASGGAQAVLINLKNPKSGVDSKIKTRIYGHSISETADPNHEIAIYYGSLDGTVIGDTVKWSSSTKRDITDYSPDITLNDGSNVFYIRNQSSDGNSSPYLDYFELHYGRELSFSDSYEFISPITGQDIRFSFSGQKSQSDYLWDITDLENPELLQFTESGFMDVSVPSNSSNHFIFFNINDLDEISDLVLKDSQDFSSLRQTGIQAEYIVLGPDQFREGAAELVNLRSPAVYAGLETIYDEFSAGNKDPMAIRSFIQWTQENWVDPKPNFLMILGDGGYDYRNISGQSSIVVPTIQTTSYATDDKLATIHGNIPELAIGRYTARNETELNNFVEKVVALETTPEFGPWRQRITLMADDGARPEPKSGSVEVGKSHTRYSEVLAGLVPSFISVEKLYLLDYPEVSDASAFGVVKPDATEDLFNKINKGTAIISYIGHGSAYQLAQEKLLTLDRGDINQMNTGMKMPLWIVGTCSFGHFDDPLTESFAEELIREPMNAASMIISTSRPISVQGNGRYTREIFETIFENDQVTDSPVGIILQIVKDGATEGQYFHLFGDPAMLIPMPKETVTISEVSPDTLETLGIATFHGIQTEIPGNGNGYVTIIDANREVTREYQVSSDTHSLSYTLPGATLFRGQFSFIGESFSGDVRIPQDISYSNDPARLMVYVHDDEKEAIGVMGGIQLTGGEGTNDTFGPQISFETLYGQILENGDHFFENEDLMIRLSDPLGINLTNETGHEIQVTDMGSGISETITENFYYDQNSIITGTLTYSASSGQDVNIRVKAWDNANNPAEKEIQLSRSTKNELKIKNAYNYPNPFSNFTQFAFEVTLPANVKLDVYTLGGRRIKSFDETSISPGYHTIDWDGMDAFGGQIANGVYLYRLKAVGDKTTETYIGRCAKYQ